MTDKLNDEDRKRIEQEAILKDHKKLVNLHYMKRRDVVPYYADLIVRGNDDETKRINKLILSKWKRSGLLHIIALAWKTEINGMTIDEAWKIAQELKLPKL